MHRVAHLCGLIVHTVIDEGSVLRNLPQIGIQFQIVLAFTWDNDWLTGVEAKIAVETRLKGSSGHHLRVLGHSSRYSGAFDRLWLVFASRPI